MTMPAARWTAVALFALLFAPEARAGAMALRPARSLYMDSKEGPLKRPEGVACSAVEDGFNVVVADTGNHRILRYKLAKDGTVNAVSEARLDQLPVPVRLQLDSQGNAVVLDARTRRLVRVGTGGEFRGFVDPKNASAPAAVRIASFKLDASDNAVVLDLAGPRVLQLDASGNITRQVPLPPGLVFTDVAVDKAGVWYAVDAKESAIWVADSTAKEFKRLTPAMKSNMSFPVYVAVDRAALLVVDQNGAGLAQIGIDGAYQGRAFAFGVGEGMLGYPSQACVTAAGETFVADRANNRIQLFVRPE
jgi:sugar lactone lactonase YvrE